jgi:Lrp/AsnC family transcriptional regulator
MTTELDALDIKILTLMQQDASLSTAELAEKVGVSQSPCWRRIQRLREDGYIKGTVALLDRHLLGFPMQIFALFSVIMKLPGVQDIRSIVTLLAAESTTAIPLKPRKLDHQNLH